ncbi:MAG: hypothetical protein M3525_01330 [Acidobacteriota bacterium]|nr:hypothetical protein [Acidobacteriota bacterium]
MEVNKVLEEKLWNITRPNPLDKSEFAEIIEYLFKRFSDYLQQSLEVIGIDYMDEDSFCRSFRGEIASGEPFKITYVGVIGMETIGDDYEPHTSANLYLFGNHHRLAAGQSDRSYIYLEYQQGENGVGNWISHGWEIDEFDEYEDIVEDEFL